MNNKKQNYEFFWNYIFINKIFYIGFFFIYINICIVFIIKCICVFMSVIYGLNNKFQVTSL